MADVAARARHASGGDRVDHRPPAAGRRPGAKHRDGASSAAASVGWIGTRRIAPVLVELISPRRVDHERLTTSASRGRIGRMSRQRRAESSPTRTPERMTVAHCACGARGRDGALRPSRGARGQGQRVDSSSASAGGEGRAGICRVGSSSTAPSMTAAENAPRRAQRNVRMRFGDQRPLCSSKASQAITSRVRTSLMAREPRSERTRSAADRASRAL